MAKKVNEVQNGDIKSNIVVLRSVFGKVGQKYYIQPQKDARGRYADCVRRVNSEGDIILTPAEIEKESKGMAAYIPVDKLFIIEDGKTYNLGIFENETKQDKYILDNSKSIDSKDSST